MANFTARVELHDANWDDYVALHKKMAAQGFSQTITSSADRPIGCLRLNTPMPAPIRRRVYWPKRRLRQLK